MNIVSMTSVAVIASDPARSRKLYVEALGLPLEPQGDSDYYATDRVDGTHHFGVWPLADAAGACFGTSEWPSHLPVPQTSLEFEVESPEAVRAAAVELEASGFPLLHAARQEPWGQTVARLLSDEGAIVGISYAPFLHPDAGS